ncbi:hypothetical protein [Leucothrix pacifica]|uniref:Uncharacterized protein n=1 Tax=Leucothrix pacifica TaxID=1247513 RepID=A0A317C8D2_9GAMM|nr:hypothetical protein [Leucothrix pacifica]PWQ92392.1 hypothetical protein DKW60_21490 [Leucothrix pacifica]
MANRASRYARYLPQEKLEISLFPFLSIFLCVMGVLSFINILSSVSAPQKIQLTMELEQGYKVAFQIFTLPDGMIVLPPVNRLQELQKVVSDQDKAELAFIILNRQRLIDQVMASQANPANSARAPDTEDVLEWMYEIRKINEMALQANFLYEEFVLFGVYPNGGQAYQKVRSVMSNSIDAQNISVGLEPLDANWSLSLHNQGAK